MRWASLLLCLWACQALAQASYPARPVRIIVPSPPAGGTDIVGRVLADHFTKAFGQQFFVENKPGAGNIIGIEAAARAAPDGYTLLMTASTLALNSVLYKQVPYDPVRDFAPITLAATAPNVLIVNPGVRPAGAGTHDQARTATPGAAIAAGADYLVVGRAITQVSDPALAAEQIAERARETPQSPKWMQAGCARSLSRARGASRRCPMCRRSATRCPATRRCSGTGCSRLPGFRIPLWKN